MHRSMCCTDHACIFNVLEIVLWIKTQVHYFTQLPHRGISVFVPVHISMYSCSMCVDEVLWAGGHMEPSGGI